MVVQGTGNDIPTTQLFLGNYDIVLLHRLFYLSVQLERSPRARNTEPEVVQGRIRNLSETVGNKLIKTRALLRR